MPLPDLAFGRAAILVCAVVLLALPGCGRRGPLEPPAGAASTRAPSAAPSARREVTSTPTTLATRPAAVVLDSPEGEVDEDNLAASVSPYPTPRRRQRGYEVPKEPFFLDPLL